jgi:aconitate hydratase
MMRGTFANIRIKNEMLAGVKAGSRIFRAANRCHLRRLDEISGRRQSRWSSSPVRNTARDHPVTGRRRARVLLGVKAVIAESFERIHRSNLVGMGVLPLVFKDGKTRQTLNLDRF